MHIFKEIIEQEKERKKESIIILTTENFKDFEYLRDDIKKMSDSRFVIGTGVNIIENENRIIHLINATFDSADVTFYSDVPFSFFKKCLIYTDDTSENDTIEIAQKIGEIAPTYKVHIRRRKTQSELIEIAEKEKEQKKG